MVDLCKVWQYETGVVITSFLRRTTVRRCAIKLRRGKSKSEDHLLLEVLHIHSSAEPQSDGSIPRKRAGAVVQEGLRIYEILSY